MEYIYYTVSGPVRTEQTIEKSRFITSVRPVSSREEGDAFFKEIRKEFRDATHNVPALVVGEKQQIQWGSDDGEPQGTAGAPIVQMIVAKGLTNVAVVVSRYFGGIKLGTGGLVRAYTSSAEQGIKAAGIAGSSLWMILPAAVDYSTYNRLVSGNLPENFSLEEVQFEEKVRFNAMFPPEKEEENKKFLLDISSGLAELGEATIMKKIMPLMDDMLP